MLAGKQMREELAATQHDIWAYWMGYLFGVCDENGDGSITIPERFVKRWKRQAVTHYAFLSEEEKESDRRQADKVLATLGGQIGDSMTEQKEDEVPAVTMSKGTVFVGGTRAVVLTSDHMNWYTWPCPLASVIGLSVDDGLLAMVGDGQLAVSMLKHQGRLWQAVDLDDEPTCLHVVCNRIFVGTESGRLFEFKVTRPRGLLARLGFPQTTPMIEPMRELKLEPCEDGLDNIQVGGD